MITTARLSRQQQFKVTLVGPLPPPYGGVSIHLMRLHAGLLQRRWQVEIVAAARTPPETTTACVFVGNSPVKHVRAALRCGSALAHVHDRISLLSAVSTVALRARGIPTVLTLHGEPRSLLTRRQASDVFLRMAIRSASRVIAVSDHVAAQVRHHVLPGRLHVIPAYLPPSPAEIAHVPAEVAAWLSRTPEAPLLTALVYRILPPLASREDIYGLDSICRLVHDLTDRGYRVRLALLLAQDANGAAERAFLVSSLQRLRADIGENLGFFVGAYAPPVIARTSVFLRPTLTDGDAVSVREALSFGVPVVASDVAPRPTGTIVFRRGSAEAFLNAVTSALDSPARGKTALNGNFGDSANLSAIEAIYRSAIDPVHGSAVP